MFISSCVVNKLFYSKIKNEESLLSSLLTAHWQKQWFMDLNYKVLQRVYDLAPAEKGHFPGTC